MPRCAVTRERGFTLVETLVALAVIVTAAVALVALFLQATSLLFGIRRAPIALAAAESKLEQLRALPLMFDAAGIRVDDEASDTSRDPPAPSGGTGLRQSPPDSLERDVDGYIDRLDRNGRTIDPEADTEPEAAYFRRWSIANVADDPDLIVIRSCVWQASQPESPAACVATVRARHP